MRRFILSFAVLLSVFGCKKSDEEFRSWGTLTYGETTFEIDMGAKEVSPANVVIDGKLTPARNIIYLFSSTDGKNVAQVRFLTTKHQLASGSYFINSESVMIYDDTAEFFYLVEEDYGQTDRISVAKINLEFRKRGEIEIIILNTEGDNKTTIKWEGKLQ